MACEQVSVGAKRYPQIRPSTRLKRELRDLVEASFENARSSLGDEEYFYVGQRIDRKLESLRRSSTSWVREMGQFSTALYSLYQDHAQGELELSPEAVGAAVAALFYLVNPYDIVPDHVPGEGYLDDAHVINLAVRSVEAESPGLFFGYLKAVASEG